MPWKKNRKYRPRRRRRGRRSLWYKQPARAIVGSPLPNSFLTKHRYVQYLDLNIPLGGAAAGAVFSLNGMYDPDVSGGGHQPMGFDQLAALYGQYQVLSAKATVKFITTSTANTAASMCALAIRNSSTLETDPQDIMERPDTVYDVLPSGRGAGYRTLSIKKSIPKFFGIKKSAFSADDGKKGTASVNPTEMCYLHVYNMPDNSGEDETDINVVVTIDYIARWDARNDFTGS